MDLGNYDIVKNLASHVMSYFRFLNTLALCIEIFIYRVKTKGILLLSNVEVEMFGSRKRSSSWTLIGYEKKKVRVEQITGRTNA